ncbi:DUF6461 domain-containing protein [Nonomuraea sp. NPDC059007]|uniref:DUF6461 domain-containing protein n=1 Tax=Nonomuraea sp. NPDC059007 TaxID=3346692 RepID=UPI0036C4F1F1
MRAEKRLYELLSEFGLDDEELPGFSALWAENISPGELARALGSADLTGVECGLDDIDAHLAHLGDDDGAAWIGPHGDWALAIQVADGCSLGATANLLRVSRGRRAIGIHWDLGGNDKLAYAADGVLLTRFAPSWPDSRTGENVRVLDPFMAGLRFQMDDPSDRAIVNPVTFAESVSSALVLAGRVTGTELDATWLRNTHRLFVLPSN